MPIRDVDRQKFTDSQILTVLDNRDGQGSSFDVDRVGTIHGTHLLKGMYLAQQLETADPISPIPVDQNLSIIKHDPATFDQTAVVKLTNYYGYLLRNNRDYSVEWRWKTISDKCYNYFNSGTQETFFSVPINKPGETVYLSARIHYDGYTTPWSDEFTYVVQAGNVIAPTAPKLKSNVIQEYGDIEVCFPGTDYDMANIGYTRIEFMDGGNDTGLMIYSSPPGYKVGLSYWERTLTPGKHKINIQIRYSTGTYSIIRRWVEVIEVVEHSVMSGTSVFLPAGMDAISATGYDVPISVGEHTKDELLVWPNHAVKSNGTAAHFRRSVAYVYNFKKHAYNYRSMTRSGDEVDLFLQRDDKLTLIVNSSNRPVSKVNLINPEGWGYSDITQYSAMVMSGYDEGFGSAITEDRTIWMWGSKVVGAIYEHYFRVFKLDTAGTAQTQMFQTDLTGGTYNNYIERAACATMAKNGDIYFINLYDKSLNKIAYADLVAGNNNYTVVNTNAYLYSQYDHASSPGYYNEIYGWAMITLSDGRLALIKPYEMSQDVLPGSGYGVSAGLYIMDPATDDAFVFSKLLDFKLNDWMDMSTNNSIITKRNRIHAVALADNKIAVTGGYTNEIWDGLNTTGRISTGLAKKVFIYDV